MKRFTRISLKAVAGFIGALGLIFVYAGMTEPAIVADSYFMAAVLFLGVATGTWFLARRIH